MIDKLKELIENAPTIQGGVFQFFLIVSNGIYDGFWGENGYNNIIILAKKPKSDVWYKLCEEADKFTIFNITEKQTFNLDIPSDYGVPRIWFHKPIKIDYSVPTADIFGYMETEADRDDRG